jgi:CDP-diacylglycerol---glycerol-3-phosphate 3-phosphatidyltransferase
MKALWDAIQRGYLRLVEPLADWLVRRGVSPNAITTVGTLCTLVAGVLFALGWMHAAGWVFGLTAVFDVLDGTVARRTGRASRFGAFYDSTLDRVADGAVLGGVLVFYAWHPVHRDLVMVVVSLIGIIGAFLTSYTRARAEALGIDAKVGMMQRPERVTLLAAPQGLFGLAFDGRLLDVVIVVLAVTSWITVVQRIRFVHSATLASPPASAPDTPAPTATPALPGETPRVP